ncbi:MAG: RNA methyltransferase [Candidatus Bathyarchaeia archaeon]
MEKKKLCIAIPASVISDTPHLREKTSKIGLIGRAAAIFRVNEIIVYPDDPRIDQKADANLISTLLAYMETPQYLRKRLFKLRPELHYVGILPPLRTPHHPLNYKIENLRIGEYREGVTISQKEEGTFVEIGIEQLALIPNKQLPLDKRVTVKITKIEKRVEAELANRNEITDYWGYSVTVEMRPLGKIIKNRDFDMIIATSKYGVQLANVMKEVAEKWKKAHMIIIAFGAPSRGLYEIVKDEGLNLDDLADFVVNTVPMQGTETIRTEEALIASLAILNFVFCL